MVAAGSVEAEIGADVRALLARCEPDGKLREPPSRPSLLPPTTPTRALAYHAHADVSVGVGGASRASRVEKANRSRSNSSSPEKQLHPQEGEEQLNKSKEAAKQLSDGGVRTVPPAAKKKADAPSSVTILHPLSTRPPAKSRYPPRPASASAQPGTATGTGTSAAAAAASTAARRSSDRAGRAQPGGGVGGGGKGAGGGGGAGAERVRGGESGTPGMKAEEGGAEEEAELDRKAAALEAELRALQEERLRVTLRAEELRLRKAAHDKCGSFELQLQAELGLKLRGLADEQKAKVATCVQFKHDLHEKIATLQRALVEMEEKLVVLDEAYDDATQVRNVPNPSPLGIVRSEAVGVVVWWCGWRDATLTDEKHSTPWARTGVGRSCNGRASRWWRSTRRG